MTTLIVTSLLSMTAILISVATVQRQTPGERPVTIVASVSVVTIVIVTIVATVMEVRR